MSTETNTDQPPALPDTSGWVKRAPGDVIEAGTPYAYRIQCGETAVVTSGVDGGFLVPSANHGTYWTPPPAPREPWSVLSTDRDKPTLAKVTYTVPGKVDQSQTARVYYSEGTVLDEWDYAVADLEQVVSVESLTVCPVTHVPVERALIEHIANDPHSNITNWAQEQLRASLASDESSASDGGQS